MNENIRRMTAEIERVREKILEAERYIWNHPEAGYREWNTHAYLKEQYEKMGYTLHEAGNIPGFWCEADTGIPGPCIGVFGEMDSLIVPTHPECDHKTGAVHACGHHAQCAALLGVAAALAAPGALDGLCGKVRLFVVPAEELIELDFRNQLIKDGVIRFAGGKQEFLYRGYLDGVDIAIMIHTTSGEALHCTDGSDGCVIKRATFHGKACHAANPEEGNNALYAANCALNAANALRETFRDEDAIRFHPILSNGGTAVNAIPDAVTTESYVRGKTMEAIATENRKINRAFAASAAAMGCGVHLSDQHGYAPRLNDTNLQNLLQEVSVDFLPAEKVYIHDGWSTGCSDFGDIEQIMPAIHPHIGGAAGLAHGADYRVVDPVLACVTSAKLQVAMVARLLENGGAYAEKVLAEATVPCKSVEEYMQKIKPMEFDGEAVSYEQDGTVVLHYQNL